jgi:hypothetical protein
VAELARPDHDDAVGGGDSDLLLHFERRGRGLHENRRLVRQRVGHGVQVPDRQTQVRREGAVASDDAEHRALLAVRRPTGAARHARAARGVDLTGHAPPHPCGRRGSRDDRADELVPRHAREGIVAAHELEVGVADPGQVHAHQRLVDRRDRQRNVLADP